MSTERLIFRFNNGEREVFADPLVLKDRIFIETQGSFWEARRKVRAMVNLKGDDETPEANLVRMEGLNARKWLIEVARIIFGMAPFDDTTGKGATATECLAVTQAFLDFLDQKKTSTEPQQTISPSTESIPPQSIQPTTPITLG